MFTPTVAPNPPFDITRASHVRYLVSDLARSLDFYTEVLGFVLSDREGDVAYLRGIEEAAHHSVVLTQRGDVDGATAECLGMRVRSEDDLQAAKRHFEQVGGTAEWVDRPYQGPSLLTSFGKGMPPIEFTAWMETRPRVLNDFRAQKGGRVLRLDHYQCVVPDVPTAVDRFLALGFRPSKYTTDKDSGRVLSIFMARKNNPHDLVLAPAAGPRLHHSAYVVSDLQSLFRAADIAGNMGFGRNVEHGPGRHGPPNGIFLYFRDPDGNRIEFILPPMQFMDPEDQPNAWTSSDAVSLVPWGGGPPQRWREEMSRFDGIPAEGGPLARWTSLGGGHGRKGRRERRLGPIEALRAAAPHRPSEIKDE